MTSVLSPCSERMYSDTKTKSNNFALVERYINLVKSVEENDDDCSNAFMSTTDQEVPVSYFCDAKIKTEVMEDDEQEPELVPDTPTILCDLSNYLPSETILHPAYNNTTTNTTTTNNNNNFSKTVVPTSTTIINIPNYSNNNSSSNISSSSIINHHHHQNHHHNNIPTSVYRDCDSSSSNNLLTLKPSPELARKQPQNYFTFKPSTVANTTPFSSYCQSNTSSPKQQQQQQQQQHFLSSPSLHSTLSSSTPTSSLSSTPSSQSQFWSMSSPTSQLSPASSLSSSPSLHRQILSQNTFSSSLPSLSSSAPLSSSSSMFINSNSPAPSQYSSTSSLSSVSSSSSSLSPSPLLSSTPRPVKPRTYVSELSGSGCTMLSGIPNFLSGDCYSGSGNTGADMMAPSRTQDEGLEYTDLDNKLLPEISFYDDLTYMDIKDQHHHEPSSFRSSMPTSQDEGGVPLEVIASFMRDTIEKDRKELNLPYNPQCWYGSDVSRWVRWVCQKNGVPDISAQLESYSGANLCSWTASMFEENYGTSGSNVFQELDLWKTAANMPYSTFDDVTSGLFAHLQVSPSPSISPAPSHGTGYHSNNSHDSHNMLNSCMDNSEDDVFYHDNIKMEIPTPAKAFNTTNANNCTTTTTTKSDNNNINSLPAFKSHQFKPRLGRGHKKAITLWQFLLELLVGKEDYSDCIQWLNKDTRVFKIQDSKKVASLWGKVKSRPAMNYDKLSRSVRQYYKKGIIKKPEQTKRLVYQFCPGIC